MAPANFTSHYRSSRAAGLALGLLAVVVSGMGMRADAAQHTVQQGDTLHGLSRRYGVSVAEIRAANGLEGDNIVQGKALKIPKGVSATTTAKKANKATEPVQVRRAQPANASEPAQKTARQAPGKPAPGGAYTVQSGDSLSRLASRYGTTVAALREANGMSGETINIGETLVIPRKGSTPKPPEKPAAEKKAEEKKKPPATASTEPTPKRGGAQHYVTDGDRLALLAKRFGVTVDAIRKANNLDGDFIRIGQLLVIPGKGAPVPPSDPPEQEKKGDDPPAASAAATREQLAKATPGALEKSSAPVWEQPQHYLDLVDLGESPSAAPRELAQVAALDEPAAPVEEVPAKKKPSGSHVVEEGDSLWKISRKHKVSIDELRAANGLKDDNVQIGQKLLVP